jgi:RimJ/RimL family protein N-acetyltransferase
MSAAVLSPAVLSPADPAVRAPGPPAGDAPPVRVRPIEPADADRLVRFHRGLSSETTRLRYFSPHPRLSATEVEHLTRVDHHAREALVALVGDDIVGVGRFERLDDRADQPPAGRRTRAEVAFVVTDRWQHRGIATTLLRGLLERARAEGIALLEADTLWGNEPMIAVFEHAGLECSRSFDDGVLHYVMRTAAVRA